MANIPHTVEKTRVPTAGKPSGDEFPRRLAHDGSLSPAPPYNPLTMRLQLTLKTALSTAFALLAAVASLNTPVAAAPGDLQVTPGELVVEHPTLINLGFEWHIDGDANRNAGVEVSFRKQGETAWRRGMPLVRLHGEQVFQRNVFNLVVPNMFAGSILDLEPGTAYDARFVLTDPDGVGGPAGDATKIVTVRTRPEPVPARGARCTHVYPTKWLGPRSSRRSKGSCAPTTTTAAQAIPRPAGAQR